MMNREYKLTDLGAPLYVSRSSELYLWEENKLLKLFFEEVDPEFSKREENSLKESFQKKLSEVECFGAVKIEGRTGLLIKKLNGKTLLALLAEDASILPKIPEYMAALQLKMHAEKSETMISYKSVVMSALESEPLLFLSADEKKKAQEYIQQLPDGENILHLDYHPDNIMSDGDVTSVIDWATAAKGVPAADVATTVYILADGEVPPGTSKEEAEFLANLRAEVLKNYLAQYRKVNPISDEEIAQWRLATLVVRLGVWNIESEKEKLQVKIREEIANL